MSSCQKALDEAKSEVAYHQSTAAYIRNERRHIEDRLMAAQADPTNPAVSEIFDFKYLAKSAVLFKVPIL